jgi:hypothetical protein
MIKVNDKLTAFYGAMFPTLTTVVEAIDENGVVWHRDTSEEEGSLFMTHICDIRTKNRCEYHSPIGVYFKPENA